MEVIRLDEVSLLRRTQEEFSYDLKKTLFSLLEGKYRKPAVRSVLNQVSLVVNAGEKIGIIGANGSGKSTLLKIICNILEPTSGKVRIRGNIAPLIELGAGFDPEISVAENIILYGVMLGFSEKEMRRRTPEILEFAELEDYAAIPVKALSSGMVARLGFAIATDVQPDILILDEVLSVGDERFKNKCKKRIERFWESHSTVLIVSHDLEFIRKSCEQVIWLEHGKVKLIGQADEVIAAYIESVQDVEPISDSSESPDTEFQEPEQLEESEKILQESDLIEKLPTGEVFLPQPDEPSAVVVTRVFLADEHKQLIHNVQFDRPFYIGIEYVVNSSIHSLQIGTYIHDSEKRVILEPATLNWLPTTGSICELGKHCVYAKVPAPLLLPSQYTIFGIGAYEPGFGHHYRLLEYLLSFEVQLTEESRFQWFGQELVHPPIEWHLD